MFSRQSNSNLGLMFCFVCEFLGLCDAWVSCAKFCLYGGMGFCRYGLQLLDLLERQWLRSVFWRNWRICRKILLLHAVLVCGFFFLLVYFLWSGSSCIDIILMLDVKMVFILVIVFDLNIWVFDIRYWIVLLLYNLPHLDVARHLLENYSGVVSPEVIKQEQVNS